MPNKKTSELTASTSAAAAQTHAVVSGSTNKKITNAVLWRGVQFVQEATAVATATIANLPVSANISELFVKAITGSSGGAGGSIVNVGIGTDATFYGTITTSGAGFYRLTNVSARNLQSASGAVVAAAPSATAAAIFVVGVGYFGR